MSKKKKPRKKQHRRTKPKAEPQGTALNPSEMEKMLSDIGKLLSQNDFDSIEEANAFLQEKLASGEPLASPHSTPSNSVEQAQGLMYEAWEARGNRREQLARQALEITKDCADAYVLLAKETATSLNEAKDLYEAGVKAGERALGPQAFEEFEAHFWGILETRPYMRARLGLAQCLWMLGKRQPAIEHYTEMLHLNPNDNQGVRYILISCLLEENSDDAAAGLLKQYQEDASATWLYSRALLEFRNQGAGRKADACLKKALRQNPFVSTYLLMQKKLPNQLPDYIAWGDESEAVAYAADAIDIWQQTKGALEWLKSKSL